MSPLDYQLQEGKAHAYLVHRHTTLVFENAYVLFSTLLHLTRQRGQFYLQNSSQLGLNIPICTAQFEALMKLSRLGLRVSQQIDIPAFSLFSCHSLTDTAATVTFLNRSSDGLTPCFQTSNSLQVRESSLYSFPFLHCSQFTFDSSLLLLTC